LNDLVARAFTSAGIPSSKEPHGLVRSDGKRPDGLTLVPWKGGKPLAWDVTAVCTVADLYVAATARKAGAAAERAARLKIAKYSGLEDKCVFQPIAVESLGPLNETAFQFLKDLARRISAQSGDERETAFLFQRLSVSISDSTLSCSTTVLRRQTTWANGHSSVYIFLTNFSLAVGIGDALGTK